MGIRMSAPLPSPNDPNPYQAPRAAAPPAGRVRITSRALDSLASGVKIELWGAVLTVLAIGAFYATLYVIIAAGGTPVYSVALTRPFMLGLLAGQSICLVGRFCCSAAQTTRRARSLLTVLLGMMVGSLFVMMFNLYFPVHDFIQLLAYTHLMCSQVLFVQFLKRVSGYCRRQKLAAWFQCLTGVMLAGFAAMWAASLLVESGGWLLEAAAWSFNGLFVVAVITYLGLLMTLRRELLAVAREQRRLVEAATVPDYLSGHSEGG